MDSDIQKHIHILPPDIVPHIETRTGPKHTWTDTDPETERDMLKQIPHGDT